MRNLRVCAACLATDVRMFSMSSYCLLQPYQLLSGVQSNGMPYMLCWECAALVNKFNLFRHKCERAHLLLQDLYNQHDELTEEKFKQINRNILDLVSPYKHSKTYTTSTDDEAVPINKHETFENVQNSVETFFDDPKSESDFQVNSFLDDVKFEVEDDEISLHNLSKEIKKSRKERRNSKRNIKPILCDSKREEFKIEVKIKHETTELDLNENTNKIKNVIFNKRSKMHKAKRNNANKSVKNHKNGLNRSKNTECSEISKETGFSNIKKIRNSSKTEKRDIKHEPLNKKVDYSDFATAVTLTQEQQMEEVRKRQDTASFREAFFKCLLCFKGFVNEKAYSNHMRKHDPATGEFVCDMCKSRFKKRYYVADHIYKVHMTKYICKFCPFVSQCVYQASTHYKWHKGVVYKCAVCTDEFTSKSTFLSHRRIKHASEHVCGVCGEAFVSRLGLLQHNSRLHKNLAASVEKGPYCADCKVQFSSAEAYTKHTVISPRHAADSPLRRGCRDCGTTFTTEKELRAHRTALHRRLKVNSERRNSAGYPIKCAQCEEVIASARGYWQHFRRTHPTEQYPSSKPAICEYCGKGFKCKSVLAHHRNTHTRARSFPCTLCPKTFFTPQNLDNHLKSHSERRPHVCDLCNKGFKFSVALLRHRRIHTGEKPYVCDVCGKRFTDSSGRKVHVRTVHLKEPTPYVSRARLERRQKAAKMLQQPHV